MNSTGMTGTIRTATASILLAVAVVLTLGVMTTHRAAARDFSSKVSTSIANRTQSQGDLCMVGGGESGVSTSSTGTTLTQCVGGDYNGMTCLNSAQYTSCHMPRIVPAGGSPLDQIRAGGNVEVALDPGSSTPEPGDTNAIVQVPAVDETVSTEPSATPDDGANGTGEDVVAEEPTEVAPEPTATPASDTNGATQGVVTEQPVVADPGTGGDAPASGKGDRVDVVLVTGGSILAPATDDQQ